MADGAVASNDRAEASCSATERAVEELERLVDEESFRLKLWSGSVINARCCKEISALMEALNNFSYNSMVLSEHQGFGFAFFFADPGKNLHADPDPGGIRGRGLGVKGKNDFFEFFSRFR